ncbi:hypothetical protein AZ268_gp03 [Acidianus rod-shaped virus 2]|uniref:Uncharacterized protein n=1 Tax=Acidianus rod-shaped virus 2 TaxID=1732175 RepID=A0A0N9P6K3_9VIRU|nr:hypothetical protein AZ268_gp03 [Acidianus rod-shaped virus 2]ALG96871.1 hypothetical protein [Acidianus rod-shaped virus 2]
MSDTQVNQNPSLIYPGPIFQLRTSWVYKIIIDDQKYAIDCRQYVSHSGLTTEGCYQIELNKYRQIKLRQVRGLWIEIAKKMEVDSDFKFTRENLILPHVFLRAYEDFLQYLMPYKKYLVKFNNYGFTVYIAKKAPELKPKSPTITQGKLEIYKMEEVPSTIEFVPWQLNFYGHYAVGDVNLKFAKDGILVKVDDELTIRALGYNPISLGPGIYLLVHPPEKSRD